MDQATQPRLRKKSPKSSTPIPTAPAATANLAEAQSRQILAAMVAFRDGDFSVRLPADWPGTDGRIAEAFNQAIATPSRSRARSRG